MNCNNITLKGIECTIIGGKGPCFLYGYSVWKDDEVNKPESLYKKVLQMISHDDKDVDLCKDFTIFAYKCRDWNKDFSPWKAPQAFGNESFAGGGSAMLDIVINVFMPYIKAELPDVTGCFPCGYSLCGLFSLWAVYECDCFEGCVCGSGSLWFPGWAEYTEGKTPEKSSLIYLSLGKTEEKTRNQLMKRVGDETRKQAAILGSIRHILEWNEGGHFADSDERLAKGIKWIMEQYYSKGECI